jgi:hypothetical protein
MMGYFIFKIMPAVTALLFVIYLAYVMFNPSRHKLVAERLLSMRKKGAPGYDIYRRIYTAQFLAAWTFITLFLISSMAFDLYRATHTPSLFAVYFGLIMIILISSAGLYLWSASLKKR